MSMQSMPILGDITVCCSPLVREPVNGEEAIELSRIFKALSDPVRLRLLSLIGAHAGGEACVCELVDAFELTQPTISHHLKVLREAGLISSERRGTWVYYRVRPGALEQLAGLFTAAPQSVG
jgi:ArsR family transcriptional regulator